MRRILFAIAFLSSFCCFSQVAEDFSDGDFTHSPAWVGDMDKFTVDSKKSLHLNDAAGVGGYAELFTESSVLRGTTWEFNVHLLFNPSVNNYGIFYLASSEASLSEKMNGYLLFIGGNADCVSLCRMDKGECEILLTGRLVMEGVSSPRLKIKVTCDKDGNWTLWTCLLNSEEDYTEEGRIKDIEYSSCSYIGVGCAYTASRSKSFVFDDIFVKKEGEAPDEPDIPVEPDEPDIPVPGDTVPPALVSLVAASDTIIHVKYSEAVDVSKAVFYIDAQHKIKRKSLSQDKAQLDLLLTSPLENNQEYMLTMSGVKDLSGNSMATLDIGFTFYDTSMQTVVASDVVFSEIMANPKGITFFPESEYIELYNRKDLPVNLKGWKLFYGNKSYAIPETILAPHGYAVLCHEKFRDDWVGSGVEVSGLKAFPVLANTGKLLYLQDARDKLVSWVNYSDSWYKDDFKKKGGFSLECIDTDNLSGNGDNWSATVDKKGGSPANDNSVKAKFPDDTYAEVAYSYLQTSDTLVIRFTKPMDLSSLRVTDNYHPKNVDNSVLSAIPVYPEGKEVLLVLSPAAEAGEELEFELSGLKDISGYELEGSPILKIGLPGEVQTGDIVWNELLFNPFPGENDYAELYNNSEKYIALNTLRFSSRREDGTLTEAISPVAGLRVFPPWSYLCFTKDAKLVCQRYSCCKSNLVELPALPSLPDEKGNILLLASDGRLVDEVTYTEKMHTALLDNKEGIALERVTPVNEAGLPSHWLSASSVSGGGTPGCLNSQYRELSAGDREGVWLEADSFSPDGDGNKDELIISYHFTGENYQADVKIYDSSGHLVSIITENSRLGSDGYFSWTGTDLSGRVAPAGIYIVYTEAYTSQGNVKRFKQACALTY